MGTRSGRLTLRHGGESEVGGPLPERLERMDLALLGGLAALGLVPFGGLALGAHEGGGRLLLGAALVLLCGGQVVTELRRSGSVERPRKRRVSRHRLVLVRGDARPDAARRWP